LQQVDGFRRVLRFPPPIKLTATIKLKYCWKCVKHNKPKPNWILSITFLIQNLLILYLILVIELQNQITIVVVRTRSLIYSMTFVVFVQSSWWGVLDTTLCDKVCQWLAGGQWLFPDTPVFQPIKHWPPRYNWNIVVSGIKHHNAVVQSCWRLMRCSCDIFSLTM
jgi:hypothetical protein